MIRIKILIRWSWSCHLRMKICCDEWPTKYKRKVQWYVSGIALPEKDPAVIIYIIWDYFIMDLYRLLLQKAFSNFYKGSFSYMTQSLSQIHWCNCLGIVATMDLSVENRYITDEMKTKCCRPISTIADNMFAMHRIGRILNQLVLNGHVAIYFFEWFLVWGSFFRIITFSVQWPLTIFMRCKYLTLLCGQIVWMYRHWVVKKVLFLIQFEKRKRKKGLSNCPSPQFRRPTGW